MRSATEIRKLLVSRQAAVAEIIDQTLGCTAELVAITPNSFSFGMATSQSMGSLVIKLYQKWPDVMLVHADRSGNYVVVTTTFDLSDDGMRRRRLRGPATGRLTTWGRP